MNQSNKKNHLSVAKLASKTIWDQVNWVTVTNWTETINKFAKPKDRVSNILFLFFYQNNKLKN